MSVKIRSYLLILSGCLFANAVFAKTILPIQTWHTAAGVPVYYVKASELPMVDIQIAFDAGAARDGSKPGIAKFTNEALEAGTNRLSADQIAAAFDDIGAIYSSAVNKDMAVVGLRSLSAKQFFQPAVATFIDVLAHPSFPDREFGRIQKQTLSTLDLQDESPASIASKAFYRALYDGAPYGHPVLGTPATVSKLSVADLKQFHRTYYAAQNATIAIVGDIDDKGAHQLAETIAQQLAQGQKAGQLPGQPHEQTVLTQHIAFPSSQTHIMMGEKGITRKDPGYFPLLVGNHILGGGTLTSRLFDEVRDKRGLAYTVHSQFAAMTERGPFVIELQTRNSQADNAVKVVNETLSRFVKDGPSSNEMDAAKKNLTQGFVLHLASNSAIISQLVVIGFYNLPINYLDTYQANVGKVTDQEVKTMFQNIIRPGQLVTVTVGNHAATQNVPAKKTVAH